MRKWWLGVIAGLWVAVAAAAPPARTVVFDLKNFTCAACKFTVEKALDKAAGVTSRVVDPKAGTVRVTFDPARTSVDSVARAITNAGFPASARKNGG